MAFCSLPCWTYFSALARTFCLLKPNNAIRVRTPEPGLQTRSSNIRSSNTKSGYRTRRTFADCSRVPPEGHLTYRQMDRPDKANCTSGPHEPHGYQGLPKGSVRTGYQGNRARSTTGPRFHHSFLGCTICENRRNVAQAHRATAILSPIANGAP